ncbi:phosphatidylcholine and lysophosphatidylcholine phospholipase, partial [Gonapodya sp. JEL0774]
MTARSGSMLSMTTPLLSLQGNASNTAGNPFRFGFPTFTVPTGWNYAAYWGALSGSASGNASDTESPSPPHTSATSNVPSKLRSAFLLRSNTRHSSVDLHRGQQASHVPSRSLDRRPSLASVSAAPRHSVVSEASGAPSLAAHRFLSDRTYEEKQKSRDVSAVELGFGATLAEIPVLIDGLYSETCIALRDTHVAVLPKTFFSSAPQVFPEVSRAVSKIIAERAVQVEEAARSSRTRTGRNAVEGGLVGDPEGKVHVVGIVPVAKRVPISEFASRFSLALQSEGAHVFTLNEQDALQLTGGAPTESASDMRLQAWLLNREYRGSIVLLVANGEPESPWTRACTQQADMLLHVCLGDNGPGLGEFEREIPPKGIAVRKLLILLHKRREIRPGSTKEFLERRRWVSRHFHIEMDSIPDPADSSHSLHDPHGRPFPMMMPEFPQLQLPDFRPRIDDFLAKLPEPLQANIQPLKRLWDIAGVSRDAH